MVHIKGSDLKVTKLTIEKGEVNISGKIDSIVYSDVKDYGEKSKSILKRCLNNESADFSGSIAYCNEPVWWTCFSCLL